MQPKVLVLLAAYNGKRWLTEQIHSILCQKEIEVHVAVSVDRSTDGTEQWVQALSANDRRISQLPDHKTFGSAARNFLHLFNTVDLGDYDYIALSDQDDIWYETKLMHAIAMITAHDVDAYSSNVIAFWPDGKKALIHKAQPQTAFDYMFESCGPGCSFVMTKQLALAFQQFLHQHVLQCQEIDLHDWFIYAFARSRGYHWFIDPTPGMLYRQHANNVVGANSGVRAMIARWKRLNQGWFSKQVMVIANLLGYADQPPIRRLATLSLMDRLVLVKSVRQMRRRLRDQCALALYLLLIAKK